MNALISKRLSINKAYALFTLIITTFSLLVEPSVFSGKVLSILALGLAIYPLVKAIKTEDYHIAIVFLFMTSYLMIPFNYYWLGLHINFYQECETTSSVFIVLQILCVFHSIILYNIKFSKESKIKRSVLTEKNSNIFALLAIISFIFVTFGSSGQTIFQAGGYVEALEVKSSSSIFAYAVIPISLSYIYADTISKKVIAYALVAYFCFKDLLFGGRVDSLELLLTIFIIRLQYLWSRKTVMMSALAGGIFFITWGALRSDVNVGFWNALLEHFSSMSNGIGEIDYQTGNAPEVYYSSIRVIYMIENGVLNWGLRLKSFICFIISTIIPYSALPDVANLSLYKQSTYWSGGGGLGPVFFYAFAGWLGVVLFAFFVSHCMNLFIKSTSKYVRFYVILLFATTPRWYAYYPIQLIKFCFIGMLLYIILDKLLGVSVKGNNYNVK